MSTILSDLSNDLASAVQRMSESVVVVHGRPRLPSSGIVWRPGLVVTADAALRFDEDLHVTLPSGQTVSAQLKGRDAASDLALLECDTSSTRVPEWTSRDLQAGQIVVTVGRTADTGPIATMGIISGVSGEWQTWRGGKLDAFVRLDVSLYPTSSGGAVADSDGNLVGIVSAGLSRSSVLAIVAPTVNRVAEALSTRGHLARGYVGIGLQAVAIPDALRQQLGIVQETGIMALNVEPNGPAAAGGVLLGDVLLSLGAHHLTSAEDLHAALEPSSVGKLFPLQILRGGSLQETSVTVAERPQRGA